MHVFNLDLILHRKLGFFKEYKNHLSFIFKHTDDQ